MLRVSEIVNKTASIRIDLLKEFDDLCCTLRCRTQLKEWVVAWIKQARYPGQLRHITEHVEEIVAVCKCGVGAKKTRALTLRNRQPLAGTCEPCDDLVSFVQPSVVFEEANKHAAEQPVDSGLRDRFVSEAVEARGGPGGPARLNSGSVTLPKGLSGNN